MIGLSVIRYYVPPGVAVTAEALLTKRLNMQPVSTYNETGWRPASEGNNKCSERMHPIAKYDNFTDTEHADPNEYRIGYDLYGP